MGSKNKSAAAKTNDSSETVTDLELIVTEGAPPPVDKRSLFAAYDRADADVKEAEAAVEAAKQQRSDAVKRIAEGTGSKGPFDYNGKLLSITTHIKPGVDGGPETVAYSFKGARKTVEVI